MWRYVIFNVFSNEVTITTDYLVMWRYSQLGCSRSHFGTSSSDSDCILTFSLGLSIPKFSCASLNTKLMFFTAYCKLTHIYGCQLWSALHQYSYNKLRFAYNHAFRHLLQEPRWCNASKLFVFFYAVSSSPANMRTLAYSLWRSMQASDN